MTGADTPTVVTTAGPVAGRRLDGVDVFLGVPYGASTSGATRFHAPAPPAPWTEVRDAGSFGPSSPQVALADLGQGVDPALLEPLGMRAREEETSEDCLVLN